MSARTAGKSEEALASRLEELWHCRQEAWATLPNGWNLVCSRTSEF